MNRLPQIDEDSLLQVDQKIFNLQIYLTSIRAAQLVKKQQLSYSKGLEGLNIVDGQIDNKQEHIEEHTQGEQLTQLKHTKIPPKPVKPDEPEPDECCGSGCQVCVFDRYYQQLEKYEDDLAEWEEKYGES